MKLALHRSITFWSGLLMMGFVSWGWLASMLHPAYVQWRDFEIGNCLGRVWLQSNVNPVSSSDRPTTIFNLPYWLIALAVAMLWCGLPVWRARRKKRHPIMKLQLHRSLTFWFGLLVIGFVCWAWWTSSRAAYSESYGDWVFGNVESRVSLGQVRMGSHGWSSLPFPLDSSQRMRLAAPRFLRHLGGDFWSETNPVQISGVTEEFDPDGLWLLLGKKDDWQVFIPHWMILIAVATLWLGFLLGRARRRKHMTATKVEVVSN